ncbi:hypothetical protein ERJ75_000388300 [Trypanosoma vivax]|nr:hypothetical protein ERJ75_000388300 [Trypanosoma vivax]
MRRALLPLRLCATSFGRVVRVAPALARRQPRCKRWCSLHVAGVRVPTHALGRVWLCPLTRVRLSCFHSASWSRCVPAKFALRAFRRRRASLRLVPPHSSVAGGCRRCTLPAQGVGSEWRGPAVTVLRSAVSLLCSELAGPFPCVVCARETARRGPARKDATRPRWRSSAHLPCLQVFVCYRHDGDSAGPGVARLRAAVWCAGGGRGAACPHAARRRSRAETSSGQRRSTFCAACVPAPKGHKFCQGTKAHSLGIGARRCRHRTRKRARRAGRSRSAKRVALHALELAAGERRPVA